MISSFGVISPFLYMTLCRFSENNIAVLFYAQISLKIQLRRKENEGERLLKNGRKRPTTNLPQGSLPYLVFFVFNQFG